MQIADSKPEESVAAACFKGISGVGVRNDSFGVWAYSVLRRLCTAVILLLYEGLEVAGVSAAHSKSTGLRLQP